MSIFSTGLFGGKNTATITASLDDLNDVTLSNLNNNEVLTYNSSTQKWENRATGALLAQVDYFADLPPASLHNTETYEVLYGSGVWLYNRKVPGRYCSNIDRGWC